MVNELIKAVLEQDDAPVVICDMESIVRYMNPSAIEHYHRDLTGRDVRDCHPPQANAMIERVLSWFRQSEDNNKVYTYRNDKEDKDVYMIALRNGQGELIGYYEKHEYRKRETAKLYDMKL